MTRPPRAGGKPEGGKPSGDDVGYQSELPFEPEPEPVAPSGNMRTGGPAGPKRGPAAKTPRPKSPRTRAAAKKVGAAKTPAGGKPSRTSRAGRAKAARTAPAGFGGWLWLLAIGQLLVTARMIDTLMKMAALVGGPVWQGHRGLVITDLALYGAAFLLQLAVLAAMALRKRAFVPLFVASAVAFFLIGRIEPLLAIAFLGMDPGRLLARAVLMPMAAEFGIAFGWCAYVLYARRVKNTFVR